MNDHFWKRFFVGVILLQIAILSLRLTDPFVDGRFHINWAPPFWLLKAQNMHEVNFAHAYFGAVAGTADDGHGGKIATGWYTSHPQFIAIPLYLWTGLFGFKEWSVRSLAGFVTILTTIIFWFAWRERHTLKEATLFSFFWSLTPIIIIFCRKLDQEPFVIFFAALAMLGHERFHTKKDSVPWLWAIAIFGMMWSDWSGFIFGGLLFIAQICASRLHAPSKKLMVACVPAGVAGVTVVVGQTILQSTSTNEAVSGFKGLYAYRSGSGQHGFWLNWTRHQLEHFWLSYGSVVGYIATFFSVRALGNWKQIKQDITTTGLQLKHLAIVFFVGTFLYALIIPQATFIHIYYQYYYSIAVAFGCVLFIDFFQSYISRKQIASIAVPFALVIVFWLFIYFGLTRLYQDKSAGFGFGGEIDLIKVIYTIPPTEKVIMVDGTVGMDSWLDNPNIEYYAGRQIRVQKSPEIPFDFQYVMIGNQRVLERAEALSRTSIFKNQMYKVIQCSRDLCLLHIEPRK